MPVRTEKGEIGDGREGEGEGEGEPRRESNEGITRPFENTLGTHIVKGIANSI